MTPDFYYYAMLGSLVGSGGIAWGAASATVNRTKESLDKHVEEDKAVHKDAIDRLARIETKVDLLIGGRINDGLR